MKAAGDLAFLRPPLAHSYDSIVDFLLRPLAARRSPLVARCSRSSSFTPTVRRSVTVTLVCLRRGRVHVHVMFSRILANNN